MRLVIRAAVASGLLLLASLAGAASPSWPVTSVGPAVSYSSASTAVASYSTDAGVVLGNAVARNYALTVAKDGVAVADQILVKTPAVAGTLAATATRVVTLNDLALAVQVLKAGWTVGSAIAEATGLGNSDEGLRFALCQAGWCYDPGTDPTGGGPQTTYQMPGRPVFSDSGASCADYATTFAQNRSWSWTVTLGPGNGEFQCNYTGVPIAGGGAVGTTNTSFTGTRVTTNNPGQNCPAYIDALNPAYSNASPTPGWDGKCPTGRYTQTATAAQVVSAVAAHGDPSKWAPAAQEAVSKGVSLPAGSTQLSGPSSQAGPSTTTTTTPPATPQDPNPTPVTTTQPSTYNYQYVDNSVTWNVTNTTTNPDGSQTSTTAPPQPICGVPGYPECNVKVDETGTPDKVDYSGQTNAVQANQQQATDQVGTAGGAAGKDTTWHWSFTLPSGCSSLQLWEGMVLDICPWVDWMHTLMTYVWVGFTMLGCFWLVTNTLQGGTD